METLLLASSDVLKHYINTEYLVFSDKQLNMLLYTVVCAIMNLVIKYIFNIYKINIYNYIYWHIKYTFFQKKEIIFPILRTRIEDSYSPYDIINYDYDTNYNDLSVKIMWTTGSDKDIAIINNIIYLARNKNPLNNQENYTFIKSTDDINYSDIANYKWFENLPQDKCHLFARINGHNIYINRSHRTAVFLCKNYIEPIKELLTHMNSIYTDSLELLSINFECIYENTLVNNKVEIKCIGKIKKNATFDNYVSRYKNNICMQLDKFKHNTLYKNNPYIENNLGFLLYGTYGTGKTYLVSAIANYLQRPILIVNLAKIKTKSEFREVMSPDNITKYVFCFDEFDYLLTEIMDTNTKDKKKRLLIQLNTTSSETDKNEIINKLKTEIEEKSNDKLTYEFVLSELSGVTSMQDRIIVATTNFIDKIPSALKRPGRFDIILNLDVFNTDEISELLIKLYKPTEKEINKLKKIKFPENKFTPATIIFNSNIYPQLNDMINFLLK